MDIEPSVDNENVAGRTGDMAPYFMGETITYVCADGFRTVPALTPIVASCTSPPTWTPPANAATACQPGKTLYYFVYCISSLQSEHETTIKTASISEGFD